MRLPSHGAVYTRPAGRGRLPSRERPNSARQRPSKGAPGQAPSFFSALTKGGVPQGRWDPHLRRRAALENDGRGTHQAFGLKDGKVGAADLSEASWSLTDARGD